MDMPNRVVKNIVLFLGACILFSCQKELTEGDFRICSLQKIEVFEGSSNVAVETYVFEYVQAGEWPTDVSISIPGIPYNEKIPFTLQDRRIDLGAFGFLEMDGSRRITALNVEQEFPGALEGDYFYGYNNAGFLQDRLYDDGLSDFEVTTFSNNGTAITGFETTFGGPDPIALGTITYLSGPNIGNDVLLPYADLMPELLPFFPLIKIGRLGNLPPERLVLNLPTLGGLSFQYQYSNFTQDNDVLTGFDNAISVSGAPAVTRRYRFGYICR
jgi:hypothetical protein